MAAGIAVAAIILGTALWGLFKGGVKIIWAMGSMFAGIILATLLNPILTDFMNEQIHLNTYIEKTVEEKLELSIRGDLDKASVDVQSAFIDRLELPATWKKSLKKNNKAGAWSGLVRSASGSAVKTFTGYLTVKIAQICVNTIAFILTFILVTIILGMISMALGLIDKLPILGQVNKLVGGLAGLGLGILITDIIMVIIAFGKNYAWGSALYSLIETSKFASFFYNHNLIFWILSSRF